MNLKKEYQNNGFLISEFKDKKPLLKCKEITNDFFNKKIPIIHHLLMRNIEKLF